MTASARWPGIAVVAMLLAACSSAPVGDGPPSERTARALPPDPEPRSEPLSRYGNPASYEVFGKRYYVKTSSAGYRERGKASWYGSKFHGRRTSSGETYDMHAMTAAHKTLPLPTYVRVHNIENGRSVVVRVNDRGPFHEGRIIDLSYAAARKLGIVARGTGLVEVEALDPTAPRPALAPAATAPAPAVAAPAAPRLAGAAPAPRIFLQAGAFAQQSNAVRLRSRLVSLVQVPVRVETAASPTLPMHRVRLGPLADVYSADRLAQRIMDAGLTLPQIVIE
jgi:rare lipoprotein A